MPIQSYFDRVVLTKIPKEENIREDALSQVRSGTKQEIQGARQRVLIKTEPFIMPKPNVMQVDETDQEWAAEVIQYLKHGVLPRDKAQARKVKLHSA
jgi:hypothetical protein